MPANTDCRAYPYPLDADLIDVAGDIKKLAEKVDDDVCNTIALVDNKVSVAGDTMTGMLTLPGTNPTSLNHAVRKGWADTTYLNKTGDAMSGDLDMNNHNITNLGPPDGDGYAARKSYVDSLFADAVSKVASGPGTQHMASGLEALRFVISDPESPNGPNQATPKWYVDEKVAASGISQAEGDARYVRNTGTGTNPMTGALVIGGEWDQEQPAIRLQPNGCYFATVEDVTTNPNLHLNRSGTSNAPGQMYIGFYHDVDTIYGSIKINTAGDDIDYSTTSDHRLKERLGPITDSARRVQELASAAFRGRWRGYESERDLLNAHDIATVAPYAVHGEKDGPEMQMVDYGKLVPLLVSALGVALNRIDRLEAGLA